MKAKVGLTTLAGTRMLDAEFDLRIRAADRLHGYWEASGDIVQRSSGKSLARVYGKGRTAQLAEQEVNREADRWLLRGPIFR